MGNIKKLKKNVVIIGMVATLTVPMTASASIPVIDDQNIMQQLKTYMESIKIVTNTAQQIALQLKELESLPQKVLQTYKDSLDNSIEKATGAAKKGGFLAGDAVWDEWWGKAFPVIKSGGTTWDERGAEISMQEIQSMSNKQSVQAYHELIQELEESKKRLQQLLELNMTPEGQKQAAQISNQIAAEKAHIETVNTSIQALSAQNQAVKNQVDATNEKNQYIAAQAAAAANSNQIDQWTKELGTGLAPAVDDPWTKYGVTKLGW